MHISFAPRELRDFCNNPSPGALAGLDIDRLKARLADLDAVDNLTELIVGKPDLLTSTAADIPIAIGDNYALRCRVDQVAAQNQDPVRWNECHWIMVESLEPIGATNE